MNTTGYSPSPCPSPRPSPPPAGGNRCGHAPAAPRFDRLRLPEGANPARPAPILKAVARLREYYTSPREARWDALSQTERRRRHSRRHPTRETDVSEAPTGAARSDRWRQQRSERREAVVLVLGLMVYYTDISSLIVAVPRGPDHLGLSTPWVASHTGLSPSRVKRALATLARASWLTNTGRGRQFDARRRRFVGVGWGPVRKLSFQLVRALGLEVSWAQARRKARKARTRPETSPAPACDALASSLPRPAPSPGTVSETQRAHARALRQALASPAARQAETDPAAAQARVERNRRTAELAARGLSPAEIRQILDDAPQPP